MFFFFLQLYEIQNRLDKTVARVAKIKEILEVRSGGYGGQLQRSNTEAEGHARVGKIKEMGVAGRRGWAGGQ